MKNWHNKKWLGYNDVFNNLHFSFCPEISLKLLLNQWNTFNFHQFHIKDYHQHNSNQNAEWNHIKEISLEGERGMEGKGGMEGNGGEWRASTQSRSSFDRPHTSIPIRHIRGNNQFPLLSNTHTTISPPSIRKGRVMKGESYGRGELWRGRVLKKSLIPSLDNLSSTKFELKWLAPRITLFPEMGYRS
jgi:hypothetical protein